MGIGNSQESFEYQRRKISSSPGFGRGRRNHRRRFFPRRRSNLTTQPILPTITQPFSYQPLYGPYYSNGPAPGYAPLQPVPSPYLPMRYNNYPGSSNMPPQYMMVPSQRAALTGPTPYMSPPPSIPYMQQPQIQPAYNNIGIPASMPGGSSYYPSPYPSAPFRLITDWTGGGKISPGFLGPPI